MIGEPKSARGTFTKLTCEIILKVFRAYGLNSENLLEFCELISKSEISIIYLTNFQLYEWSLMHLIHIVTYHPKSWNTTKRKVELYIDPRTIKVVFYIFLACIKMNFCILVLVLIEKRLMRVVHINWGMTKMKPNRN